MSLNLEDRLKHILDEMEILIELKNKLTEKQFYKDEFLKRTAMRCFSVIGEAVKHIPDDIRRSNADIEWKLMASMRDIMIHHYFEIDYEVMWETMTQDIPPLKKKIKKLLKQLHNG